MDCRVLVWPALAGLLCAGCSSLNVNPPVPRANTGYVDFYTDSDLDLSWRVKRADERTGELRSVFSEFDPVLGNILRLASPPGTNQFEVWFINRVTTGPQTVLVPVEDRKITPVHVTLTSAGSVAASRKSEEFRSAGRITRRVTRSVPGQTETFEIKAVAESPQDYQPKERTRYFSEASK